ncbi:MAG: DUF6204 family protein [Brevibacterium sp.]
MTWTFRITVRGRFDELTEEQRRTLRDEQEEHDMFAARFTPEGTFLYTPELVNYQHRYLLDTEESDPQDAEALTRMHAEELSTADLSARGLSGHDVDVSAVCIESLKIRPGRRR